MKMYDAATALAFVENARKYVEKEVNETIFPEILYPSLIPVDTSAPEWTKTIEYRSQESYGKADWINGNADDIPLAGNSYNKTNQPCLWQVSVTAMAMKNCTHLWRMV